VYLSRTQAELKPVLASRKGIGTIPAKQAFPLHTLASDNGYGIFADGLLSIVFRVPEEAVWAPSSLVETLPLGSGVQVYRHYLGNGEVTTYLAVSSPIPYVYRFSILKGLLSLFQPGFVKRETAKMEEATTAACDAILKAVASAFVVEEALPLEGFEPLLTLLGLERGTRPERRGPATYNMGYLALSGGKVALLADCQALPSLPKITVPLPPLGHEALYVTTLRVPLETEQSRLSENYHADLAFHREVLGAGGAKSAQTLGRAHGSPKRFTVLRSYYLLMDTQATRLRDTAEQMFRAFRASGFPAHASHLATKDQFCHLFPGNVNMLPDGLTAPITVLGTVLERLLP